jgi:hypothetical protein
MENLERSGRASISLAHGGGRIGLKSRTFSHDVWFQSHARYTRLAAETDSLAAFRIRLVYVQRGRRGKNCVAMTRKSRTLSSSSATLQIFCIARQFLLS